MVMIKKTNILIIAIIFSASLSAIAQDGRYSITIELPLMRNKNQTHFPSVYFSVSYLSWNGLPSNVQYQPNNNRGVDMYKMFNLLKNKSHFNLAAGLSASVINLHNNVLKWQFDSSSKVNSAYIMPDTFDRHKLTAWYLYVPVEVKYKFGSGIKKPFVIAVGGKIGTAVFASVKSEKNDVKIQERIREGLSRINYGVYGYFGYKFVGIFGGYNFSPLFDSDYSPKVTNWSAGLGLIF
jgi:hypothetical protein